MSVRESTRFKLLLHVSLVALGPACAGQASTSRGFELQVGCWLFLRETLRLRWRKMAAIHVPPKKSVEELAATLATFPRPDWMRWELAWAVATLRTRSITLSGDWTEYQTWRIEQEQIRLCTFL